MMTISTSSARSSSGIASAIARAAARLPSQHTTTRSEVERRFLDVGNDDDAWPARIEQGGFDDLFFNRTALGFGLPDNREIEVPCNTAELVGSAGEIGAGRRRLSRDPRAQSRWRSGRWRPSRRRHCRAAGSRRSFRGVPASKMAGFAVLPACHANEIAELHHSRYLEARQARPPHARRLASIPRGSPTASAAPAISETT